MNKINKQKVLIEEFKNSIKNKDFKPTFDSNYGTKYKGVIKEFHFFFYAVIRRANVDKGYTKPSEFLYNWNILTKIIKQHKYSESHLKYLQKVFPSLTLEDVEFFTQNYENINESIGE
jgi:hypothetical protein